MDEIDLRIIELLKTNSRMTGSEISKRVNLSIPAVIERIRKLEDGGVIHRYTVRLNREKFNLALIAFIFITLEKSEYIKGFREAVIGFENVLECHHIAGEYDYLLKVAAKDTKGLEELISDTIKKIPGVAKTNTIIALSTIKEEM